jgi:hypothetical protein
MRRRFTHPPQRRRVLIFSSGLKRSFRHIRQTDGERGPVSSLFVFARQPEPLFQQGQAIDSGETLFKSSIVQIISLQLP